MSPYRELFLAVTIASASIVFADILVQPGYEHQHHNNPHYLQYHTVPRYRMPFPAGQYYAEQLAASQLANRLPIIQTMYPYYGGYQDQTRSNIVGYPHHHHHLHLARIGGHKYVRPSVFVGSHYPLAQHRYKRSIPFNPTSIESSKLAIATHDVATKSPLINVKHPAVMDSLLQGNEHTNTNDNVQNYENKNDHVITEPGLFGLYPENKYSRHHKAENLNKIQHPISKSFSTNPSMSNHLDEQSAVNTVKLITTEPTQQTLSMTSQQKRQNQEASYINHEGFTHNRLPKDLEQFSNPITILPQITSKQKSKSHVTHHKCDNHDNNDIQNTTYTFPLKVIEYYPANLEELIYWPSYNTGQYSPTYNAATCVIDKNEPTHQQTAYQEFYRQPWQKTTYIDETNKRMPRQNRLGQTLYRCINCHQPESKYTPSNMPIVTMNEQRFYVPNLHYRSNEEPSRENYAEIDMSNFNRFNTPFTEQTTYEYSDDLDNSNNLDDSDNLNNLDIQKYGLSNEFYSLPTYDDNLPHLNDLRSVHIKRILSNHPYQSNTQTSIHTPNIFYRYNDIPEIQPYSITDNDPIKRKYIALPQTQKYDNSISALTQNSVPVYNTLSSPTYY